MWKLTDRNNVKHTGGVNLTLVIWKSKMEVRMSCGGG